MIYIISTSMYYLVSSRMASIMTSRSFRSFFSKPGSWCSTSTRLEIATLSSIGRMDHQTTQSFSIASRSSPRIEPI